MNRLVTLDLHGFKSIKHLNHFPLEPVNVLIGANGAGKSNLISFFKMLNWMTFAPDQFQFYVGKSGGASALLHDGAAITPYMQVTLGIQTDAGLSEYQIRLSHAATDTLIFTQEQFRFSNPEAETLTHWNLLGSGHREAALLARASTDTSAKVILSFLKQCVVYHFYNTSETARIKQRVDVNDSLYLRDDAANLAAFLYRLREHEDKYYQRIVAHIRQIAPFFVDFVLEPSYGTLLLQWRERGTDLIFGSHQISDGTLRIMALVTLLLQPPQLLPDLIILDEPELGLHPYAIEILAGLIQGVALRKQLILATQSTQLINYFEPEQIVVVDRPGRESTFKRLDSTALQDWLQEYSLAELWEKNVLGGKPA